MAAAYRPIAARVTRAYSTMSDAAAAVIARHPPLETVAAEHARAFRDTQDPQERPIVIRAACRAQRRLQHRQRSIAEWKVMLRTPRTPGQLTVGAFAPILDRWVNRGWDGLSFRATQVLTRHRSFGIGGSSAKQVLVPAAGLPDDHRIVGPRRDQGLMTRIPHGATDRCSRFAGSPDTAVCFGPVHWQTVPFGEFLVAARKHIFESDFPHFLREEAATIKKKVASANERGDPREKSPMPKAPRNAGLAKPAPRSLPSTNEGLDGARHRAPARRVTVGASSDVSAVVLLRHVGALMEGKLAAFAKQLGVARTRIAATSSAPAACEPSCSR
ncbi:hypothetical protein KM043_016613 [Ampulex compressa]|nr:hypothetical protein KM043_016613 [Ampulex compressa]